MTPAAIRAAEGPACACGCGQIVGRRRNGSYNKFVKFHYPRSAKAAHDRARVPPQKYAVTGARNGSWKGGRRLHIKGYVVINHNGKQAFEHRVVMEKKLGRPLRRGEVVHHINGVRDDNRPENLELVTSVADHSRHHHAMRRAAALTVAEGGE